MKKNWKWKNEKKLLPPIWVGGKSDGTVVLNVVVWNVQREVDQKDD